MVLYSTHCPRCNILEAKLKEKNVEYKEVNDISVMEENGIDTVPILEIDGKMMKYAEAYNYVINL